MLKLMVSTLLVLSVWVTAAVGGSIIDGPYTQFVSHRMPFGQYKDVTPSQWRVTAPLTSAHTIAVGPNSAPGSPHAWVLTDDALWDVSLSSSTRVDGSISASVVPSSSLATAGEAGVFVSPKQVIMFRCATGGSCKVDCTHDKLALSHVRAVALADDGKKAWIATADGLFTALASGATCEVARVDALPTYPGGTRNFTSVAVSTDPKASVRVAAATNEAVFYLVGDEARIAPGWRHTFVGNTIESIPTALAFGPPPPEVAGASERSALWVAQDTDALSALPDSLSWVRVRGGARGMLPLANISSLAVAGARLWGCGMGGCMSYDPTDGEGDLELSRGPQFKTNRGGVGAVGHGPGYRVFEGPRWVACLEAGGGEVLDVTASASGAWVLSSVGVAFIAEEIAKPEQKVNGWESRIKSHDRYGFIAGANLKKWGDLASISLSDGDNDGSDNAQYVVAQTYRYAVTKDEEARAAAWKHFLAVEFLHNVTQLDGMVARTLVKCGEKHQMEEIWYNSTECYEGVDAPGAKCCWTWKGMTSSDEIDGHIWVLRIVHDYLAQSKAEKIRVARLLCSNVAYIVSKGYYLVDKDGRRTPWGFWAPEKLNDQPAFSDERGLNSLEMLAYLAAAHAMVLEHPSALPQPVNFTFAQAIANLVTKNGYGENLLNMQTIVPGDMAYFDHNLASWMFQTIYAVLHTLTPETVPMSSSALFQLKSQLDVAFEQHMRVVVQIKSLYYTSFLYDITGDLANSTLLANSLWGLHRAPSELIPWPDRNSQRLDVLLDQDFVRCCHQRWGYLPMPPDESGRAGMGDDPYSVDNGNAMKEDDPNKKLVGYWLTRFALEGRAH